MARSSRAERMRRLLLEDSRDDSSSASAGTSEMKHNPCPFDMPSTINESKDDDSSSYLSNEYKPIDLKIETPLSIGEIQPYAGVDGIDESFDLEALDRHQHFSALSNRVVDDELQLMNKASPFTVRSIDAHSNPDVIDQWIYAVEEGHATAKTKKASATKRELPNVEKLMKPLPKEMEDALNSGEAFLPPADIDMSLEDYVRVMCSLFGIPVKERLVDSIHNMMCLFMEYKDREASNDISVTVEDWS